MSKILLKNIKQLIQAGEELTTYKKGKEMEDLSIIDNAFLAIEDDEIIAYGKMEDWGGITDWRDLQVIDADGKIVMPAFCDSHTHVVFAKTREEEFKDRIKGLTYEEIALKGGGILNSAKNLQAMSEDELYNAAFERLITMASYGTGAVEIKSGYGLTVDSEIKMLRVINRLKENSPITIKATFLGAHAFPQEYNNNHRGYLDLIVNEMLPIIAKENLADFIDCFCERNYYSLEEMEEVLVAGAKHGLTPKVHVNQFSVMGGVALAVKHGARSVDHLEKLDNSDIKALRGSNCMPTLLPGCSFFLSRPFGRARDIIDNDLPVAIATDYNPGFSPSGNIQLLTSFACTKMKMTPNEAINATTINSAYAMGLEKSHGKISLGKKANLIITKPMDNVALIPYSFGENSVETVILNGKII